MSSSGRNQRNCNELGNQLSHENQSHLDLSPWIISGHYRFAGSCNLNAFIL